MTRLPAITVLMLGSLLPVGSAAEDSHASVEAESYRAEFEAWKSERITRLRAEDGWLSLAGLLWLQKGENSFGSAADNTILFPEPAPAHVGVFTLREGKVSLVVAAVDTSGSMGPDELAAIGAEIRAIAAQVEELAREGVI